MSKSEQQSTAATEQSSFGHWTGLAQDSSAFDGSMGAGTSRAQPALELPAREVDKVDIKPHIASKTTNTQPEVSEARESGPRAAGTFALGLLHVVDLDSSFDDELQTLALTGLSLAEEEQRMRYFEAMDLSLERRFSEIVQLYASVELDSDDDGDYHERLITPGALEVPSAWLMGMQQETTVKKPGAPSPEPSSKTKLDRSYPSVSSPRGLEALQKRIAVNDRTSPQTSSSNAQPQLEHVASIRRKFPPLHQKDHPTSQVQSPAAGIPDMVAHSARVPQGSTLLEAVPMDIPGRRGEHTPSVDAEEHRRAQAKSLMNAIPSTMPDKASGEPLLPTHGLGIVCIDRDTRRKGSFETGRPTLTRSTTEPVPTYFQSHPRSTTDNQSNNQYLSHQPDPTNEARWNKNVSSTSSGLNSAPCTIDISVYTSTTSLPPLQSSARRASIVLPPDAIKVFANPKDREVALSGTFEPHSSQYEYRQIDSDSSASSPSRSRSQRSRRSALHPAHPYAIQAAFFASACPGEIVSSELSHKQDLTTNVKGDFPSSNNKHWPSHLNAPLSDEPLQMPASQSHTAKYSRPRLPPRYYTDTLLASSSYRRDSTVPPSAPKLPWHRMFDGPFLS